MAKKKLGYRAFMNRLRKLGPERWIQQNWVRQNGETKYCDMGWMGHLHGIEPDNNNGESITSKLCDIYDVPLRTLRTIPSINDRAGSWEENLALTELYLQGKVTFEEVEAISRGELTLEQVQAKRKDTGYLDWHFDEFEVRHPQDKRKSWGWG